MSQTDGPGADCKSVAREFDSFLVHMDDDKKVWIICSKCKGEGQLLKNGEFVSCGQCQGSGTVEKK